MFDGVIPVPAYARKKDVQLWRHFVVTFKNPSSSSALEKRSVGNKKSTKTNKKKKRTESDHLLASSLPQLELPPLFFRSVKRGLFLPRDRIQNKNGNYLRISPPLPPSNESAPSRQDRTETAYTTEHYAHLGHGAPL